MSKVIGLGSCPNVPETFATLIVQSEESLKSEAVPVTGARRHVP